MALNKVAKYVRNLGKSVVYAADETAKNIAPSVISYSESNAEVAKSMYHAIRDFSGTVERTKKYIETTRIYEAGGIFKNALFEDLTNGTFYNKARVEKYSGKALGINMDFDDDFNFDEDIDKSVDLDISDGDKATIESIESTSRASSSAISNAVVETGKYQAEVSKANTALILSQQERLFGKLNAGVDAVNTGVNNLLKFNTSTLQTHIQNSTKFFDVITKNTQEQTAILKEMLEMQRNQYTDMAKEKAKLEKKKANRRATYSDLTTASGAFSVSDYFTLVNKNLKMVSDDLGLSQLGFFDENNEKNALAAFAANPLGWIPEAIVQAAIGPKLKKELKNFDNVVSGIFGTVMARLSKMSKSNNEVESLIGRLFGVRDDLKRNINTSKYVKGPIPFDGETKKAITDVIPTLLANIESALTGKAPTRFNYETGKYTTTVEIQKQYRDMRRNNIRGAFSDVLNEFVNMMQNGPAGKPLTFGSRSDEKEFYDDIQRFFTKIYNDGGYFNPKKPGSASDFAINEENFRRIVEMYRRLPRRVQMQVGGNVLDARTSFSRLMEDAETKGNSVYNILSNGSNIKDYIKVNSRGEVSRNKDTLLIKDDLGHDYLYYLNRILKQSMITNEYLPQLIMRSGGGGSGYGGRGLSRVIRVSESDVNIERESTLAAKVDSRFRDDQRDIARRAEDVRAGRTVAVSEGTDQFAAAADTYSAIREQRDLEYEIDEQPWLAKWLRDSVNAEGNRRNANAKDNAKDKLRDKVQSNLTSFADRFKSANTITEKWHAITDQIGVLVAKPTTWIAEKLNAASENIYNFLFEDEMDGGPGKRVKGFFNAIRERMMKAFDKIVDTIDKHIIDPIMNRFGGKTGILRNAADRIGLTRLKDRFWEKSKQRTKEVFSEFGSGVGNQFDRLFGIEQIPEDILEAARKAYNNKDPKYKNKSINEIAQSMYAEQVKQAQRNGETTINAITGQAEIAGKAKGARMINKTGLSVLSEGEMVIPSELNPFYKNAGKKSKQSEINKERGVSSSFATKLANFIMKNISSNAEGNDGNGNRLSIDPRAQKIYSLVGNKVNSLVINHGNANVQKAYKEIFGDLDKFVPEGVAGGALGGVLGLVTGLGPFAGLVIGSGVAIARKSDVIQEILFGELDENGERKGGMISKQVQDTVKKAVPDLKLFGTVGGVAGLLGLTPFGIIGGLTIGGALAMAKNNQSFMNFMFGEEGLIDQDKQKFLKKAFPNMAVGTVATYALGPFGLIGSALIGSGLGMLSATDRFKTMMLGDKLVNGKRVGGLVGIIRTNFADPLINFGKELTSGMMEFLEKDIYDPLRKGVGPLLRYTGVMMGNIAGSIGNVLRAVFSRPGVAASKYLDYYLGRPVRGVLNATVGNAIRGGVGLGKRVISAPFKTIGYLGNKAQGRLIASGNASNMTADERLAWRYDNGVTNDAMFSNDVAISNYSNKELQTAYNAVSLLGGERQYANSIKEDTDALAANIVGFLPENKGPRYANNIVKLLTSEKEEDVKRGLRMLETNGKFASFTEKNQFFKFVQDRASNIRENRGRQKNYKENRSNAMAYLKKAGLNVNDSNYKQVLANLKKEYRDKTGFARPETTPAEELVKATQDGTDRVIDVLSDIVTLLSGNQLSSEQIKKYTNLRTMMDKSRDITKSGLEGIKTINTKLGVAYSEKELKKNRRLLLGPNGNLTDKYLLVSKLDDHGIRLGSLNNIKNMSETDVNNLIRIKDAALKGHVAMPTDYKNITQADISTVEKICKVLENGIKVPSIREAVNNPDGLELLLMRSRYDMPENMTLARAKSLAISGNLKGRGKWNKAESTGEYKDEDGSTKRIDFTDYGPITYVKSTDGSWDYAKDPETKKAVEARDRAAKATEETNQTLKGMNGWFSKIFGKDGKEKKKKKDEGDSLLSKLFGGLGGGLSSILSFGAGGLAVLAKFLFKGLFGAGKILAIGKLIEVIRPHIVDIVSTIVQGIVTTIPKIFDMVVNGIKEIPGVVKDIGTGIVDGLKKALFGTKAMTPEEARAKGYKPAKNMNTGEDGWVDPEGNFIPETNGMVGEAKQGLMFTDPWAVGAMGALATYKLGKFGYDTYKKGKDYLKTSNGLPARALRRIFGINKDNPINPLDLQAQATTESADRIIETSKDNTNKVVRAINSLRKFFGDTSANDTDLDIPDRGRESRQDRGGDKEQEKKTKERERTARNREQRESRSRRRRTRPGRGRRRVPMPAATRNGFMDLDMSRGGNTRSRALNRAERMSRTPEIPRENKIPTTTANTNTGVVGKIKDGIKGLINKLPKVKPKMAEKIVDKVLPKVATRVTAVAAAGALTGGVSFLISAGMAAWDFFDAYDDAENILNIENPTETDRLIAGVCGAISGATYGLISAEEIGALYMESPLSDTDLTEAKGESPTKSYEESKQRYTITNPQAYVPASKEQVEKQNKDLEYKGGFWGLFGLSDDGKGKYGRGGFFKQDDPRYADMQYNSSGDTMYQNMRDSGCGPIAAVNALYGMGGGLDPTSAARYALDKGYKEKNGGTRPEFFSSYFRSQGKDSQYTSSGKGIMDNLKQGNPVVLMGQSNKVDRDTPYGVGPHYVTATGLDGRGNMIIQDPQDNRNNIRYKASTVLSKTKFGVAAKPKTGSNRFGRGRNVLQSSYVKSVLARYGKGPATTTATGADIPQTIWNFLIGKGLSSTTTAAIMGNICQESRYQPGIENPDSGAYGICQWTETRKEALARVAAGMGVPMSDINAQLNHLWNELTAPGSMEAEALQDTIACGNDLEKATITFCGSYESGKGFERGREYECNYPARIEFAKEAFNKQGKGINVDGSYVGGGSGSSSGSAQQQFSSGFMGVLERKAAPLQKLYNQIFGTPGGGTTGSSVGGATSGAATAGGHSKNPQINQASQYANSVTGQNLGYGPSGCTRWANDYLTHAGIPNIDPWVPTAYQNAQSGNPAPFKPASAGAVEGDVAIIETNQNPGDGPDHVVIADGEGGYWGNSSSKLQIVHSSMSDWGDNVLGYIGTGGPGSGNVAPASGGQALSAEQMRAEAGPTSGGNKYGRGKYGRGGGIPPKKGIVPLYDRAHNEDPQFNPYSYGKGLDDPSKDYTEIFKQMLQALLTIAQNTATTPVKENANSTPKDGNAKNTAVATAQSKQNAVDKLKAGLKNMGSANGIGQVSPHSDIGSILAAMRQIAAL